MESLRFPAILLVLLCFCRFSFAESTVDFGRDIRPILSAKCFFCHGPDEEHRKADLRLDRKESALHESSINPGNPEDSEVWLRITSHDDDDIMPPPEAKKPLSAGEKQLLKTWIEEGAEWSEHWSFVTPEKPVPSNKAPNAIDSFIRDSLSRKQLTPATEADRGTLLRRLSFDLTGLPPTLSELENFRLDETSDAYEKQVDRLLASPKFGERMALMWLDAARYGDTSVMHADGPRDMWPWRDWVIEAYNSNKPYDQFSIEQIAGDLLPDASLSQKIATGFNRNHPSSDEGGAIAEELRVSYVADRVKTTANVWLGLSMECAQCHDHKFDPISQKEYYQFYAYFNNTADPGMQTRKGNQMPFVEVVSEIDENRLEKIDERAKESEKAAAKARGKALSEFSAWVKSHTGDATSKAGTTTHLKNLQHYYPLDEPSGNLLTDVFGRRDAAGEKALRSVKGKNGKAVVFNGATTWEVPDMTEYDSKSKITFAAWVKIDSNFTGAIFSKMNNAQNFRGFDFWLEQGKAGVHLINNWPKNAIKVLSDEKIAQGEWQHVAVSYDGSGKAANVKIYINGKPVKHTVQGNASTLKGTMKNTNPFRIGGRKDSSYFKGQLDDIQIYNKVLSPAEIALAMENSLENAILAETGKRSREQQRLLTESFLAETSDEYRKQRSLQVRAELERIEVTAGKTTTMVMQDNPGDKMRKTYILDRGAYDSPEEEEEILPATPGVLPSLPENAPKNRLSLANWLFTPGHPLTARVAVNQLWQLFFGTGIVSTPGDFGAQGDFPSHPELLDWLAVDFRESGWDIKRMIKMIVMSQTYRQSSHLREGDLEKDATNRLLARAPRFRLSAEMIRDNALFVSGLLNEDMGGPGVKPYQPPGLWAEVGLGGNPKFVQDHDEKLYRRSLYTYWKRSAPHPAMLIFDAPNRETCVLKRPVTNTPLQALAALNDVQMLEASRHLAERVFEEGGSNEEAKIQYIFELVTARKPDSIEMETIAATLEQARDTYRKEPAKADELLSAGESQRTEELDPIEHASWTIVASMILNLDEVLTRN